MPSIKNEQGYALVTVLLIIVVFMVVFLSFMGQGFTSVKQNQVVEKKSLSIDTAEMGITYYQVAIQNLFESKQTDVNDKVKAIMTTTPSANFKRQAAITLADEIQKAYPIGSTQPTVPIDDTNASFTISNLISVPDPDTNSSKVNITFDIVGKEDGKSTGSKLSTKMIINLDSIINLAGSGSSNGYTMPTYNEIPKPKAGCSILACDEVYIDGNGSFGGNNLFKKSKQTIYTTGSFTQVGTGNENNKSNISIHAEGPITIGNNMNKALNFKVETKDNAYFGGHLEIYGTSKIMIGGNATVDNSLSIGTSSKMCVRGDLTARSISVSSSNPPGKLIVYGKVNGSTTSPYRVTDTIFKSECGTYVPPDFQINWGDNIDTMISNVDY
ncbi:hypothetical protein BACCIP111895_03459 [Neobacillus rhizosphaerae]|uniref:Type 4 fimbrial biogenesis protein PilX N-terminal domain-containing protein n=1 Tax=Neobacillus rhizosphaerae TaxID=2880965 RepID=A0ABM9EUE0_9BACI|nr:hypothetical protein [Neobacillus rhizosphaerae]CAH2716275.1 hypothetical protein BACCIP111895_03459 [Neobacillus rhizosphaerae]